jgi:prophage regulatory protein
MHLERILRLPDVKTATGRKHASLYSDISRGVFPKPVTIGPNAVGWPEGEVAAINAARIAGRTEDEIRQLVTTLHQRRATGTLSPASTAEAPTRKPKQRTRHCKAKNSRLRVAK